MEKLLLFDFDGVIVDSLKLYKESVNLCLKKIGEPAIKDHTDFLALFDENFYDAIRKKGVDVTEFTRMSAAVAPTLNYDHVSPFYDLEPVLEKLKNNNILVIVSSNSAYAINLMLSKYRFDRFFRNVLGYEFMFSKSEKIIHVMNELNFENGRTYYIGDTAGDIKEAKEVNVKTIAVTWGWHTREKLISTEPDYIIDTPEELLKI